MTEMPKVFSIDRIKDENPSVKTFHLKGNIGYKPGQFVMVWIPDVDEKPFSFSGLDSSGFSITVERKGRFTKAMFNLKKGDKIGIRGPYGNPFTLVKGKTCVIAGGCGIAPIMPLVGMLKDPTVIVGCQTASRLIFKDKIKNFEVCTDDSSFGHGGFTTARFSEVLKTKSFDMVYTCGPEPMMKAVFEICKKKGIHLQASLERFMICGIGICGQCMCGNKRVCKDGPVMDMKALGNLKDFGNYAMLMNGKKVTLKEYYGGDR